MKAWVFSKGSFQFQQLMPTRGFQSSSEPVLHFGLGGGAQVDSILIVWPDQRLQVLKTPPSNAIITVKESDASGAFSHAAWFPDTVPPFENVTAGAGMDWKHNENDFSDFNRQYLIPHKQSTRGPKLAVADVNGDGLDDFYVCGAMGQSGQLMLQTADGKFLPGNGAPFAANMPAEEVDAVFFDADGDGDKDLYVASGGYQFDDGQDLLNDHLYFNDGKGVFAERQGAIPAFPINKSCIASGDIDGDGDLDLFVGGLAHSGRYGYYQPSKFLLNDGKGNFQLSDLLPQTDQDEGMITAAVLQDINGDKRPDLMVVGEWMPLTIFINGQGKWRKQTVAGSSGLWQSITMADVNGDGLQDFLAGNWGLNSKLVSGKTGPVKMYVKDFDKNGREEQVVTYTMDGKEYTFLAKDELERALPVLKKAYLTYSEVAGETVQYMFYDLFKDYREWKAETLATSVFYNDGKGNFTMKPLPDEWQIAPVFALTQTPGEQTFTAAGNFFGVVPYEGRYDGLRVSSFSFQGRDRQPVFLGRMPEITGEVRDAKWIQVKGQKLMLLARNNLPVILLKPLTK